MDTQIPMKYLFHIAGARQGLPPDGAAGGGERQPQTAGQDPGLW